MKAKFLIMKTISIFFNIAVSLVLIEQLIYKIYRPEQWNSLLFFGSILYIAIAEINHKYNKENE